MKMDEFLGLCEHENSRQKEGFLHFFYVVFDKEWKGDGRETSGITPLGEG